MTAPTDQVMSLVSEPDYKPLTLKAMARRLKIEAEDYGAFRSAVKELVKEGRLEIAKDRRLSKPETKKAIVGLFRRSSKGFGFVRPHNTTEKSEQIFIPGEASRDASSGDEVAVKITKRPRSPGMNREGRIIQVIARASGVFVGTYFEDAGWGFVHIDGTTFREPVHVGDPGAKGAKPGDKVVIEMVRYPTPYIEGEGVITEVLGPRGNPGVDTISIIRAYNLPDTFDEETLLEARQVAKAFSEDQIGDRLDLRDTLTITIDPVTARDFDDAITLSRDDRGYWNLGVHIADVSHFVAPGSDLDRTARKRGTSVYLPDRVLPMLPEILSNSLASLQAGKVRYTLSAFMEFNSDGVRTGMSFARSAIQVDQRFTYEQAFAVMMAPGETHEGVHPDVVRMLSQMLELSQILRKRRKERGGLELNMPSVEVDLGDQGEVVGAHLASNDESHQVIEDFMLAANEAVATHLTEQSVGFLRRAHPDPEPTKLMAFAEFARSLGLRIENPLSRFELQRVLAETAGKPEEPAVHYGLLRSLKQAAYTPEPEGHFALASENYCHFTSPIRRYPDLQVHRQLTALLSGKKPKTDFDELTTLAQHCTHTERRAEAAERELVKIKLLTYLQEKIGERFDATIIAVEDFGVFCRIIPLPVEGLLHVSSLADDHYYLESETHTLIGRRSGRRYRLGDRIEVRIARIDIDRRELDMVPADSSLQVEGNLPIRRAPRPSVEPPRAKEAKTNTKRPERPKKLGKKKAKRRKR